MPSSRQNPHPKAIPLAIAAGVLVVTVLVYLATRAAHDGPDGDSSAKGHPQPALIRKLGELESALDKGMGAAQMQELAAEIETQIKVHPLPDDEDLQFSGELIVRYLRELAAIENYRVLKIAQGEKDPMDPRGDHPNTKAIEVWQKYSAWLRQRTKELKEALSTRASRPAAGVERRPETGALMLLVKPIARVT
jgi:hypothetical protein